MTDTPDVLDFYDQYPQLDTPIHREFLKSYIENPELEDILDQDEKSVLTVVEKEEIGKLVIKSDYPGDDDEKRNFTLNATEMIGNSNIYILTSKDSDSSILFLTNKKLENIEDLNNQLQDESKRKTIPCYYDKDSKLLVACIGIEDTTDEIHHGVKSGTHRDTYKGVVLARALSKWKRESITDNVVTISSPDEVSDKNVVSLDLVTKRNRLLMNYNNKDLDPQMVDFLQSLKILTIKDYVQYLKSLQGERTTIFSLLKEFKDQDVNLQELSKLMERSFRDFYQGAYWGEDGTHAVFSPGIFGLEVDDDNPNNYTPRTDVDKQTHETYMEVLNQGESIPVSIIVYEHTNSYTRISNPNDRLFVVSSSHPDAHNFYSKVNRVGRLGYADGATVAELDGFLKIDENALSLERMKTNKLPLTIEVTGIGTKNNSISTSKSGDFVENADGLNNIIRDFNTRNNYNSNSVPQFTIDTKLT